jgi:hypothetical protein
VPGQGNFLRTSRQQASKIFFGYLERRPFCFEIFDSPGVKLYHFVGVSAFSTIKLHTFWNGLGTSFYRVSAGKAKTVKRVNPKSIKISDEIEKRPKRGLLYISIFINTSLFISKSPFPSK